MYQALLKAGRFATGDLLWKLANIVLLGVAARVLPEEEAALVVLSQTASMILLSLGDLGFRSAGIRLVAVKRDRASVVVREVLVRRTVAVCLLGMPAALMCAAIVTDNVDAFLGLALIVFSYLPYFAAPDWALLALGKTGFASLARATYGLILLALAGLVYITGANLAVFALIIALGYGGFALVASLLLWRRGESPVSATNAVKATVKSELAWGASIALAIAFSLNTLFHAIEVILAGAFLGESASAAFAAPFRLVFSLYAIGWILSQYCSPRFARISAASDSGSQWWFVYVAGFLLFGLVAAAATYLGAHFLVRLVYGEAFAAAGDLLQALAPTIALDAVVACLGTMLVMQNKGKASAVTIGCGCLASAVAFFLFQDLGLMGVVYAKYAAYTGLLLTQLLFLLGAPTSNTRQV